MKTTIHGDCHHNNKNNSDFQFLYETESQTLPSHMYFFLYHHQMVPMAYVSVVKQNTPNLT